jgi:anion-transporting  ArsA/GET3 family ATPase
MTTAHSAQLLVCMGSGGVGKTTTAAALALRAAHEGRKVCVVTIDPAKRLADALGVRGELSNEPSLVSNFGDGELWAMMLDARQTFVDLIASTSTSAEQAERIHNNALFSSIARQLGGTQEYMAAEKLFQLHRDDRFDLVIVDTPPSREALNFLGAPNTLVRFLDHRVYRTFLAPARGGLKIVSAALTPIFKAVTRLVGADVITDVIGFFAAFEGLDQGFRDRAESINAVLRDRSTTYVVVTSPEAEPMREATFIIGELKRQNISLSAVICNAMTPDFGVATTNDYIASPRHAAVHQQLSERRSREVTRLDSLRETVGGDVKVATVDLMAHDVTSLDGLSTIASALEGIAERSA